MAGIWVHGELAGDGTLAKLATEVATLARALAEERGADDVTGVVIGADPAAGAAELARFVPRVLAVTEPATATMPPGRSSPNASRHWSKSTTRMSSWPGPGPKDETWLASCRP